MPKNKGKLLMISLQWSPDSVPFCAVFLTTQEREGKTGEGERTRMKATRESWSSKKMAKVSARVFQCLYRPELL